MTTSRFRRDARGATAIEYALMLCVAAAVVVGATLLGGVVKLQFSHAAAGFPTSAAS